MLRLIGAFVVFGNTWTTRQVVCCRAHSRAHCTAELISNSSYDLNVFVHSRLSHVLKSNIAILVIDSLI